MHASHFDPRILAAGFAALVLAMLIALAPSLPQIDLGSQSGGASAAPSLAAPAATEGTTGEPRWLADPLRPPAF